MNILYVSDFYLSLSVFMSQVHTICNYHAKYNKHKVKLIALCNNKDISLLKPIDAEYELIKILKFPRMFVPIINKLRALSLKKTIKEDLLWADVIHCRGHVGAAFAINLLNIFKIKKPVIADIRGAVVEEFVGNNTFISNFYAKEAKKIEKLIFQKANYLFFVSENMREYYKNKYHFQQQSSVFPTIVDESFFYKSDEIREEYRKKLKIGNKITYIYVGGANYWQNLDKILLRFNEINIKKPGEYFFIILTTDIDWVNNFCIKNSIKTDNMYINQIPYNEVGKYLNASDFGIIIRENNIINYVASPTKVNEYLACGLKIINDLDQIGKNERIYEQKYIPIQEIIKNQNDIYRYLSGVCDKDNIILTS